MTKAEVLEALRLLALGRFGHEQVDRLAGLLATEEEMAEEPMGMFSITVPDEVAQQ